MSILEATKLILDDPALPEVTSIVLGLHKMEQSKTPGAPKVPGIGLRRVVPPLKAYRYTVKNKWVVPVAAAAVLIVPFLLGYSVGRRRR